ncbi:MAG: amidohydrolase family protein [Thermodesulfobacteriota bacterium]|nr:amidohydrolase family protein [Thermodesulfobacteriota bacterium]
MNRREFLQCMGFLGTVAATPGLAFFDDTTSPYRKPDPLVSRGETLLLTNASVIDVTTGTTEMKNVLLRNGRIQGVFDPATQGIAYDRRLDLGGAFMAPGLINAHCHMSIPCAVWGIGRGLVRTMKRQMERNAEECVKHGVTTVRDMGALAGSVDDLQTKVQSGAIVGPRIQTSYVLDVPGGYMTSMVGLFGLAVNEHYFKVIRSPAEGREGVRRAADEGADLIKICHQALPFATILPTPRQMDLKTTQVICKEAARLGLPVAIHHTDTKGFNKGLDASVISFEHVACDRTLTSSEIGRFKESGAVITPTASVGFAISWETTDSTGWDHGFKAEMKRQRSRYLTNLAYEYCESPIADAIVRMAGQYSTPAYFDSRHLAITINMEATKTILDEGIDNVLRMYREGVPMGCGNDGGIPFDFPGAMGLEMYLLETIGFKTANILRMATINNARLLGMERDLGTIEAGKIADLAIFENNPLDTCRNAFNPSMVFLGGELVSETG